MTSVGALLDADKQQKAYQPDTDCNYAEYRASVLADNLHQYDPPGAVGRRGNRVVADKQDMFIGQIVAQRTRLQTNLLRIVLQAIDRLQQLRADRLVLGDIGLQLAIGLGQLPIALQAACPEDEIEEQGSNKCAGKRNK